MHPENSFITLTYDDRHLPGPRLVLADFQKFIKRLRRSLNHPIGTFYTGEYGEKTKRPHWHAIIFGWSPPDGIPDGTSEVGDQYYQSKTLDNLWGKGRANYGAVTFKSAGYCARYAAKKLVHGKDKQHEFEPICKKSNKHAIGKRWLEKYYWSDCFAHGEIVLADGTKCSVPRYYEKWLKENKPDLWRRYVTGKKLEKTGFAAAANEKETRSYQNALDQRVADWLRTGYFRGSPITRLKAKEEIINARFQQLQNRLKL